MKATLLVKSGLTDKSEYALDEGKSYLVGRSRDADVIVKDKLASRNHCKVAATGAEEWSVSDLGSSNGTYVNRQRITTRALHHGDAIQIGKATLEFRLLSATTAPTVVGPDLEHHMQARAEQAVIHPVRPGQEPLTPDLEQAETPPPAPEPQAPPMPPPPRAEPVHVAVPPSPPPSPQPRRPEPVRAAAAPPPPQPPPKPQEPGPRRVRLSAPAGPQPPAKPQEPVDEDIRGLFDFLDKVGKGGKPPADEETDLPVLQVEENPRPVPMGDERTRTLKMDAPKKDTAEAPLFSLLDEVAANQPLPKRPAPPPPPLPRPPTTAGPPPTADEQGGLLAFLRKKKQQS